MEVLHLKFHKVGGSSINSVLSPHKSQKVSWWKHGGECGPTPTAHEMLAVYRKNDMESIRRKCTTLDDSENSPKLYFVAAFRDPIERILSMFFYFHKDIGERLNRTSSSSVSDSLSQKLKNAISTWELLTIAPLNITAVDMENLLTIMRTSLPFLQRPEDNNVGIHEYEHVFSQTTRLVVRPYNPSSCATAADNMRRDLTVAGLTEHMSTFYYLLWKRLKVPLDRSCTARADNHGAPVMYKQLFDSPNRPPPEKLFTPEVIDVIHKELQCEKELYLAAVQLHKDQLAVYNHTIESATTEYQRLCSGIKREGTQKRYRNLGFMSTMSSRIRRFWPYG